MSEAELAAFRANYEPLVIVACEWRAMHANPETLANQVFTSLKRQKEPPSLGLIYRLIFKVVTDSFTDQARRRPIREAFTGGAHTAKIELPNETEQTAELRQLIAHLSNRNREILQLAYWDQLTEPEICTVLGLSSAAVAARLTRAQAKYAALLQRKGGSVALNADHPATQPQPDDQQPPSSPGEVLASEASNSTLQDAARSQPQPAGATLQSPECSCRVSAGQSLAALSSSPSQPVIQQPSSSADSPVELTDVPALFAAAKPGVHQRRVDAGSAKR